MIQEANRIYEDYHERKRDGKGPTWNTIVIGGRKTSMPPEEDGLGRKSARETWSTPPDTIDEIDKEVLRCKTQQLQSDIAKNIVNHHINDFRFKKLVLDACEAIREEIREVLRQELVDIKHTLYHEVTRIVEELLQQRYAVIPGEVYQQIIQEEDHNQDKDAEEATTQTIL